MFNNINDNNDFLYNSQLERQSNVINLASIKANLNKSLFTKDCDIKKFNEIAMSDSEDFSHLERMKELFSDGVVDVFEDDVLKELVTNSKLWDDLEL